MEAAMIALREGALNVLLTLSYSKKKNNLMSIFRLVILHLCFVVH